MTDSFTRIERSRIMAKVKSKGNKSTEIKLLVLFKKNGIKGWRRNYPIKGKPDFVFLKFKIAVFVDGCFWHGCKRHCRIPNTNREYWIRKITNNKKRDRIVINQLMEKNWKVVRIWEHELSTTQFQKTERKINKIFKSVQQL